MSGQGPAGWDSVVVVTGASSGIGRATVNRLARPGVALVLAARATTSLEQTAAECAARGAETLVVGVDVADGDAVDALLETAVGRFGRVDAVVHSAAVLAYGRFEEVPPEVFDRALAVTLTGTANVLRSSMRHFVGRGAGRLVVVGSILGEMAVPYMSTYVTAKFAIAGLVRTVQIEARAHRGIEVSLVIPGGVNTPVYRQAGTYLGRHGRPPPPVVQPERVARAVESVLARPRRKRYVGVASPLTVWAFRVAPGAYDRLVTPMMERLAVADAAGPSPGNVFDPAPQGNATHGPWTQRAWGQGRFVLRALRGPAGQGTTGPAETGGGDLPVTSRDVPAPPSAVWAVLADGWTYSAWVVGTSRVRDVDEAWPAQGSRIHHSFGVWPLLLNDATEVLACEPEHRLELEARGRPLGKARVRLRLTPQPDGGCRVSIAEDAVSGPGRLVPKAIRHALIVARNEEALRRLDFLAQGRAQLAEG